MKNLEWKTFDNYSSSLKINKSLVSDINEIIFDFKDSKNFQKVNEISNFIGELVKSDAFEKFRMGKKRMEWELILCIYICLNRLTREKIKKVLFYELCAEALKTEKKDIYIFSNNIFLEFALDFLISFLQRNLSMTPREGNVFGTVSELYDAIISILSNSPETVWCWGISDKKSITLLHFSISYFMEMFFRKKLERNEKSRIYLQMSLKIIKVCKIKF